MSAASPALAGSPEQVLAGAGRLGADAERMRGLGQRWGSLAAAGLGGAGGAWSGAASLVAAARAAQLATALRDGGTGLSRVVAGARSYGGQLAASQDAVRVLIARRTECETELVLLLRFPKPDPDPLVELRRERRIQVLRELIARLLTDQRREESLLERAQRVFADVLEWEPPPLVQDLIGLSDLREQLPRAVRGGVDLIKGGITTFHSIRAILAKDVDDFLVRARQARLWLQRLLPRARDAVRMLRWVKTPVLTVIDAVDGLITGGGYEGPRGIVHRTLSGAGLVGAVGIGAGLVIGAPVVAGIGAVALGGFAVWSVGNTIWDHRDAIGRVARRGWLGVSRAARWLFGRGGPGLGDVARRAVEAVTLPPPVRDDGFAPPSVRRPPCGNDRPIPLYDTVRDITCDWGPWRRSGPPPRFWSWPWPGVLRVPLLPWTSLLPGLGR